MDMNYIYIRILLYFAESTQLIIICVVYVIIVRLEETPEFIFRIQNCLKRRKQKSLKNYFISVILSNVIDRNNILFLTFYLYAYQETHNTNVFILLFF
jgi:hypothetical protein